MKVQPDFLEESKIVIDFIIRQRLFLDADLPQVFIFTELSSKSFETLNLKSEQFSLRCQTMSDELRRYCCRGPNNRADKPAE